MPANRKTGFVRAFDPSMVLAAIGTAAFYYVVNQPSLRTSLLHHYTTEHFVEYVIVAVFMWGIVDILLKLLSFPREIVALRQEWLPPRQGREPAANAHAMLERIHAFPAWLQDSKVGRRLSGALDHVNEKCSAKEYREHLRYLSEQEEDHSHAAYVLIRFVIGVTPVLGFLGTVIHFGTALSGISFDEMTERLPAIVGGMGTAFNTTSVALVAAMTMMFSLFLCQRVERGVLRSIDRLVDRELAKRFEFKDPSIVPFLSAVESANEEALQTIGRTLDRQVDTWSEALESLFGRFDLRQQHELESWQAALDELRRRHEDYDLVREDRLQKLLAQIEQRQDGHFAQVQQTLDQALALRDDFAGFVETLNNIARGEGTLVELQGALTENLNAIRQTEQIDKALHGLTAAIHLLTARHLGPAQKAAA